LRFQSNNIPAGGVIDPGGVYSTVAGVNIPAGTNATVIAAPPANSGLRLVNAVISAPTTVASFGNIAIITSGTGCAIASGYSAVGGVIVNWNGSILINGGIMGHNTTAVDAGVGAVWRYELLP